MWLNRAGWTASHGPKRCDRCESPNKYNQVQGRIDVHCGTELLSADELADFNLPVMYRCPTAGEFSALFGNDDGTILSILQFYIFHMRSYIFLVSPQIRVCY